MHALNTQVAQGVATQLSRQANTTQEPARRPLCVPPVSAIGGLMCPDEAVVLQQLRAKREEVLRVRGDLRVGVGTNRLNYAGGMVRHCGATTILWGKVCRGRGTTSFRLTEVQHGGTLCDPGCHYDSRKSMPGIRSK